ncbi:unnamed protein product [Lupinus luteus]|uniref:Uncharacterized protein n=1 Tax=Lupinus luteus TaxID=3873 RepID=A0AAV1Y0R4_LUPLU
MENRVQVQHCPHSTAFCLFLLTKQLERYAVLKGKNGDRGGRRRCSIAARSAYSDSCQRRSIEPLIGGIGLHRIVLSSLKGATRVFYLALSSSSFLVSLEIQMAVGMPDRAYASDARDSMRTEEILPTAELSCVAAAGAFA